MTIKCVILLILSLLLTCTLACGGGGYGYGSEYNYIATGAESNESGETEAPTKTTGAMIKDHYDRNVMNSWHGWTPSPLIKDEWKQWLDDYEATMNASKLQGTAPSDMVYEYIPYDSKNLDDPNHPDNPENPRYKQYDTNNITDPNHPNNPKNPYKPYDPYDPTDKNHPYNPKNPFRPFNPTDPYDPNNPYYPNNPHRPFDPANKDHHYHPSNPKYNDPNDPNNPYNPNNIHTPFDENNLNDPNHPLNPNNPNSPSKFPDDRGPGSGWPSEWKDLASGQGSADIPPWAFVPKNVGKPINCFLPQIHGSCDQNSTANPTERYAYNPYMDECVKFTYSGCLGNRNNFSSKLKCEQACMSLTPSGGCSIDSNIKIDEPLSLINSW